MLVDIRCASKDRYDWPPPGDERTRASIPVFMPPDPNGSPHLHLHEIGGRYGPNPRLLLDVAGLLLCALVQQFHSEMRQDRDFRRGLFDKYDGILRADVMGYPGTYGSCEADD
jgi:hypothetical protein